MEIDLEELIKKLQDIRKRAEEEIEDKKNEILKNMLDLKVKYLGKKSEILEVFKYMKNLSDEEKKKIGENINKIKFEIESKVTERIKYLERKEILEKELKEKIDLSLPVQSEIGTIHPIQQIIDDQIKIFTEMGYEVVEGPETETTHNIFDMLNTPKDHPAREMQDTFYLSENIVLRSQTSAIQIRKMLEGNLPIKIICPGRVYRSDAVDATHSPVFHQMEGLVIGENITMADLKGTIRMFVKRALGENINIRFRPHHFPYTEPSAEVDVTCFVCGRKRM
jgi:tRNA synthetases class II core domain (F)